MCVCVSVCVCESYVCVQVSMCRLSVCVEGGMCERPVTPSVCVCVCVCVCVNFTGTWSTHFNVRARENVTGYVLA